MSDHRRLAVLRAAVLGQRGEWTTRRAFKFYRHLGYTQILRSMVRHDLNQLARDGVLVLVDTDPNRRHYTVRTSA